jgi:glyoxylase-like metal-dependent hydrolase (beta-lactamase superfamily II)
VALVATTTDPAARARYQEEVSRIDAGRALAPDVPIEEAGARTLAGRRMVVGLERLAVTAADVWLYDPASGLLAAGDLVTLPAPLLDTACPRGWQAALARLSQVPFTLLVPGHGPLLDRAGLERYRTGFGRLLDCAASSEPEQACVDGWLRDLGPLVPPERQALARTLLAYYLPNVLRGPPEVAARACQNEPGGRTVR